MATSCSVCYWHWVGAGLLAMSGAIALSGDCVHAQVIPDGTLGAESSVVTPTNVNGIPGEQIDGGAARGTNLFHSFEQFSIPTGGEAFFNNALDIQNVISRVTGSSISNIDGLLRANGAANLFLLNPNGIVFGPNARLSIGGSFVGSTASSLNFADGTQFSATAPQTAPLLTVSVPIGLQFGSQAGRLRVQGPGGVWARPRTSSLLNREAGPKVQPEETLALVGSGVALEGGILSTDGGRIELGSVAGSALVSLTPIESGWVLGYESVPIYGDIRLSDAAAVDASGAGGGDIQVQGRRVTLTNSSRIEASTLGAEPGGKLAVTASESVELSGIGSGLFARVMEGARGDGGNLTLETGQLIVRDIAEVSTETFGNGDSGNLTVKTRQLIALDGGRITNSTYRDGNGGTMAVTASESVELIGMGIGANIRQASSLITEVRPGATGNGGDLTLETPQLIIKDGGRLSTATRGAGGSGGNLTVKASELVELIGTSTPDYRSGIFTNVSNRATGGNGGNLTIETGRLIIRDGATVSAITESLGSAGNLVVRASESVELSGTSADPDFYLATSLLQAGTVSTGDAGELRIETGQLTVRDGAQVTVSSTRSGKAGELQVQARSIWLDNQGAITATTSSGNGGDITLQAQDLLLMRRSSNISSTAGTAQAVGNGGNININAPLIVTVPSENSDITANAFSGSGGQVQITASGIFGIVPRSRQEFQILLGTDNPSELDPSRLPSNDITAISQTDPVLSGQVTLNNPDVDPTQGLVELPTELVDVSNQIAQGCPDAVLRGESKFIITGRGGLPPSPTEPLTGDNTLTNWSTLERPAVENRSSTAPNTNSTLESALAQIVEANGWVIGDNGSVTLTASAPTATLDIPWLPSSSCNAPEPRS